MFASMTFVHSLACLRSGGEQTNWNYANASDANDFVHANNHEGTISRKVSSFSCAESCFMEYRLCIQIKISKIFKMIQ